MVKNVYVSQVIMKSMRDEAKGKYQVKELPLRNVDYHDYLWDKELVHMPIHALDTDIMKAMQKLTAVLIPTAVQQKEAWIYLRLHQKHYLPSYLLQPNPFRKYRVIMECTECMDMLHSSRNRK